jgi:hypothetical protein
MGSGDGSDSAEGHAGARSNAETTEPLIEERRRDLSPIRPRLCDACGLPNKRDAAPLVRCSRCRAGWYHDRTCQQRHHPLHQKTCQKVGRPSATAVRVVRRPPNGNALVRSSPHESPHSSVVPRPKTTTVTEVLGVFRPVVPPVLTASRRDTHCAWCLNELPTEMEANGDRRTSRRRRLLWSVPNLIEAWTCSAECQSAASATGPSSFASSAALLLHERDAILTLHSNRHDPPMYLPTALLLFRLLVATCLSGPSKKGEKNRGQVDWDAHVLVMAERQLVDATTGSPKARDDWEDDDDDDRGEEQAHEAAVVRTVQALCHAVLLHQPSLSSAQSHAAHVDPNVLGSRQSPSVIKQLLRRIKANAFGIRLCGDTSTSESRRLPSQEIGIGIFHVAHFANHSCRPNAEAAYVRERGKLPSLSLQTLPATQDRHPPAPHDEITVSYVSNETLALPRSERRRHIFQQFGFRCICTKCRSGA